MKSLEDTVSQKVETQSKNSQKGIIIKGIALFIPVIVMIIGVILPLRDVVRQALVGVILVWLYLGAMSGFGFLQIDDGNLSFFLVSVLGNRMNRPEYSKMTVSKWVASHLNSPWLRYLAAVVLVALATVMDIPFHTRIAPTNLAMIYLVAVVISAAYLGRGPSILSSILGMMAFDFFFVPPYLTLHVDDTEYLITFAGLLAVGLVISELTVRVRDQAEAASKRETETAAMYALSNDLGAAETVEAVVVALTQHIWQVFRSKARLEFAEGEPGQQLADLWQFPLRGSKETLGRLEVQPPDPRDRPSPAQTRLLAAFASLAAQAIERLRLAERARQVQVMQETERLQTALLNSISHDLRTPLVSITGSLSTLRENGIPLDSELHSSLVETAYQEAVRLNRLVANLLNMTRLEAGAMKVVKQPEDIQDVIGASLEPLNDLLSNRQVEIRVQPAMPLVSMDFVLMVQVLVNLVDNAIKYSPAKSPISIQASWDDQNVEIQVEDRGIGIPGQDLERVFDKFYRVYPRDHLHRPGTGLGLSICKGIVEAHGGRIWAENRPGGGVTVKIILPLEREEKENGEYRTAGVSR